MGRSARKGVSQKWDNPATAGQERRVTIEWATGL
jgi:hypothetical protein